MCPVVFQTFRWEEKGRRSQTAYMCEGAVVSHVEKVLCLQTSHSPVLSDHGAAAFTPGPQMWVSVITVAEVFKDHLGTRKWMIWLTTAYLKPWWIHRHVKSRVHKPAGGEQGHVPKAVFNPVPHCAQNAPLLCWIQLQVPNVYHTFL